jgi:ADP-heptose:LPS heptosyltransferase
VAQKMMQKLHRTILKTPFLRSVKDFILSLLGRSLKRYFAKEVPLEQMKNFLFIRFELHLGSIVCTSPIFEGIRKVLPDIHIGVVCDEMNYELLKYNPNINDFYLAPNPDKNFIGALLAFFRLRTEARKYDCIIADLGNSQFRYLVPTLLTGLKYRIGFGGGHDFFFNLTASYLLHESIIERNLNLLSIFNGAPIIIHAEPKLYFSEDESEFVENFFKKNNIDRESMIVAIQTQSKDEKPNRWFAYRFAELADKLVESYDACIIFTGAQYDEEKVDQIRASMVHTSITAAGKITILQLASLLNICDLFITVDTGSMHVARSVQVPMVIIGCAYQSSHLWLPVKDDKHIIIKKDNIECAMCYKDYCFSRECMKQITVSEVFEAAIVQIGRFCIG